MFQQIFDFRAESDALNAVLAPLPDAAFAQPTRFKNWTPNDIVGHLHVWNQAAELALRDGEAFAAFMAQVMEAVAAGRLRAFEHERCAGLAGARLREAWHGFCRGMVPHFADVDPKTRVQWAGPDMSVRSSITARLMETWAHGQAIYDQLGLQRVDDERIRNIAILGINTFSWTFKNRGLDVPAAMPAVVLTAPSGEVWEWSPDRQQERIEGSATEFCQVVTQVRNIADTRLSVRGNTAQRWMAIAQCFAGPPENPPAPGTRFASAVPAN